MRISTRNITVPSDIENRITSRTKCLLLCNPGKSHSYPPFLIHTYNLSHTFSGNPSGATYSESLMKEILTIAEKYNLYVISGVVVISLYIYMYIYALSIPLFLSLSTTTTPSLYILYYLISLSLFLL